MMRQLLHAKMLEVEPRVFRGGQFDSNDEPCTSHVDEPREPMKFVAEQGSKCMTIVTHPNDHFIRQQVERRIGRGANECTAAERAVVSFRGFKVRTICSFP